MLKIGKLDSQLLEDIVFDKITFRRPEVLTRPGIGEDCAVVDFGEYECVMSTDPITAAIHDIGRLAIHITCNDIASNGIQPLGIMLAVLLPPGTTRAEIEHMMEQAGEASSQLGVEIIGGHTEITAAVNSPVIVSTAIGRGFLGQSQGSETMKTGDYLLMTKEAGIEGTGILAKDRQNLLSSVLTVEELEEAKGLLDQVSVLKEGVLAGKIGTHGMHDITEGGVLGAVWELCHRQGLGAEIQKAAVPVRPVTEKICHYFNIDPLRLISSGCMLIAADEHQKDAIQKACREEGILLSIIGRVVEPERGICLLDQGISTEVQPPESDELYKAIDFKE
jgi:hydrogenase expression/formation protein HypE